MAGRQRDGHTITGAFYADLRAAMGEKKILQRKLSRGELFHHDNAAAHKSTVGIAAIQEYRFKLVQPTIFS